MKFECRVCHSVTDVDIVLRGTSTEALCPICGAFLCGIGSTEESVLEQLLVASTTVEADEATPATLPPIPNIFSRCNCCGKLYDGANLLVYQDGSHEGKLVCKSCYEVTIQSMNLTATPLLGFTTPRFYEGVCQHCSGNETGCADTGKHQRLRVELVDGHLRLLCETCKELYRRDESICNHCGKTHQGSDNSVVTTSNPLFQDLVLREGWCDDCHMDMMLTDYTFCAHCGATSVQGDMTTVDGSSWCKMCVNDAHECENCQEMVSNVKDVGGEQWCDRCVENSAIVCEACGELFDCDNMTVVDGKHFCDNCLDENTFTCDRCEERHIRDDDDSRCERVHIGSSQGSCNETWCGDCYDNNAGRCDSCGDYFAGSLSEHGDGYYCDECYETVAAKGRIYQYHGGQHCYQQSKFFHKGDAHPNGELYLGFELEAGGMDYASEAGELSNALHDNYDTHALHFHMERDATIPDHGFELISGPHSLTAHKEFPWNKVLKDMRDAGMKSYDIKPACGLHVHMSSNFFSKLDLAKIELFITRNSAFWKRVSRRNETSYCQYPKNKEAHHYVEHRSGGKHLIITPQTQHRSAFNITTSTGQTVEIRTFCGTLNYRSFMATLEICDGLARWIKTVSAGTLLNGTTSSDTLFVEWLKTNPKRYGYAVEFITKNYKDSGDDAPHNEPAPHEKRRLHYEQNKDKIEADRVLRIAERKVKEKRRLAARKAVATRRANQAARAAIEASGAVEAVPTVETVPATTGETGVELCA